MMPDTLETRVDIVVAAHVVANAIGDLPASDYGGAIEDRFFEAGELPTLGKSIDHLERILKHARRMKHLPARKPAKPARGLVHQRQCCPRCHSTNVLSDTSTDAFIRNGYDVRCLDCAAVWML